MRNSVYSTCREESEHRNFFTTVNTWRGSGSVSNIISIYLFFVSSTLKKLFHFKREAILEKNRREKEGEKTYFLYWYGKKERNNITTLLPGAEEWSEARVKKCKARRKMRDEHNMKPTEESINNLCASPPTNLFVKA